MKATIKYKTYNQFENKVILEDANEEELYYIKTGLEQYGHVSDVVIIKEENEQ